MFGGIQQHRVWAAEQPIRFPRSHRMLGGIQQHRVRTAIQAIGCLMEPSSNVSGQLYIQVIGCLVASSSTASGQLSKLSDAWWRPAATHPGS